jgi:hypothetical protein
VTEISTAGDAAGRWIDEVMPEEFDWRHLVVRYPLTSLACAAVGGFLIGRSRGEGIVDKVSTVAAETVEESVHRWVDQQR